MPRLVPVPPSAARPPARRSVPPRPPARLLALLLLALPGGCDRVTAERVEGWRSAGDTDRLAAAAKRDDAPADLRARALVALVEAGAVDRFESAVADLPFEDRAALVPVVVPLFAPALGGGDANRATDARDALFALRRHATSPEARGSVDGALLPALEGALRTGAGAQGRVPLVDMCKAIGPSVVPLLQRVLADERAPFATAADALAKVGDGEARSKGSAALVARLQKAAPAPAGLLEALGALGGKPAVEHLGATIERASKDEAIRAAAALTQLRREPTLVPFAVRTARDPRAPEEVRERMLEALQNAGDEEARKGLVALVGALPEDRLRFRAFRAALKVGRGQALLPGLEAFPTAASYAPADVQEHVVKPIYELGWENREGLFKALESKSPVARLFAVLTLEKAGFESDAEPIAKLAKDRAAVRGFPAGQTVGKEAARVAATLKKPAT